MNREGTETIIDKFPSCDICREFDGRDEEAHYDGKTKAGPHVLPTSRLKDAQLWYGYPTQPAPSAEHPCPSKQTHPARH